MSSMVGCGDVEGGEDCEERCDLDWFSRRRNSLGDTPVTFRKLAANAEGV